jgi:TolB-like protein/Tfp pilus assembly protein PilF
LSELQERLSAALADRYVLERELGRGGMAVVFLARDLKHDRPVALKVLRSELAATLGPERFLREIRLTARLDHPHILPVLDSGEAAGLLWYTMPYVRGESLRDRLRREVQLPLELALDFTRQAASALEYAHREGLVHRDLKPENILLADGQVRVADLGLAKALAEVGGKLTETGLAVGTPAYMSPEQGSGDDVDARSDVYALGCVLYEMLAGEPPFTGRTPQAIIVKRMSDPVPSVRRLRDAVPEQVEQALTRALAKVPADRFQTAAEFASALTGVAALRQPRPLGLMIGALGAVALVVSAAVLLESLNKASTSPGAPSVNRIAVLPFENLGDSADAYFADGIADAVRGKLTGLKGLEVIARGSSMVYRTSDKRPDEIARELGVRYLLTGTVRWAKAKNGTNRVQVSPELIELNGAEAPASKWQQPFDAALTDVFQVQADIASRVAQALDLALGTREHARLAEPPTTDLVAYDAFLRAEDLSGGVASNPNPAILRRALPYYEQAVALDSTFVEAWARLSLAHSLIYVNGTHLPTEAEAARRSAEQALAIAPERPEGRLALGKYYADVLGQEQRGLEQYAIGLRLAPHSADLLTHSAFAEQNLGRWEEALDHFRQAQALDPRSVAPALGLTQTLLRLHRHSEALQAAERGLALDAANPGLIQAKAMVYLAQGDLPKAKSVITAAANQVEPAVLVAHMAVYEDLFWVLDERQQALLLRLPLSAFGDDRFVRGIVLAQTYALHGEGPGHVPTPIRPVLRSRPNSRRHPKMPSSACSTV